MTCDVVSAFCVEEQVNPLLFYKYF